MRDLIGALLPGKRLAGWPAAVEAIRAGAAYLAQGSSYSYLRARTLLAGPKLFQDKDFAFALDICKWEGFAVAAQDLILMIESELRPSLPSDPVRRGRVLSALYREVLDSEEMPEHRRDRGWSDAVAEFDARLEIFLPRKPLSPDAICTATALRLLEHAPIDEQVREADRMMVVNNVAFRFIEYQAKLRRKLDFSALALELSRRMDEAP